MSQISSELKIDVGLGSDVVNTSSSSLPMAPNFPTPGYEGRPSYMVETQAMGLATMYILALFMLAFFGDELFSVSLFILF
jgi:hypothetical protein